MVTQFALGARRAFALLSSRLQECVAGEDIEGDWGMGMARSKGAVGIVGLGIMGGAFAKNLAAAGWRVVGYDIDAARRRAMAKVGVEIAKNAADVAKKVPTIITSLPSPRSLDMTAKAIAGAKLPRKIIVEMSTFTIADKER